MTYRRLFIECHPIDRETVLEPLVASYPQGMLKLAEDEQRVGSQIEARHVSSIEANTKAKSSFADVSAVT